MQDSILKHVHTPFTQGTILLSPPRVQCIDVVPPKRLYKQYYIRDNFFEYANVWKMIYFTLVDNVCRPYMRVVCKSKRRRGIATAINITRACSLRDLIPTWLILASSVNKPLKAGRALGWACEASLTHRGGCESMAGGVQQRAFCLRGHIVGHTSKPPSLLKHGPHQALLLQLPLAPCRKRKHTAGIPRNWPSRSAQLHTHARVYAMAYQPCLLCGKPHRGIKHLNSITSQGHCTETRT